MNSSDNDAGDLKFEVRLVKSIPKLDEVFRTLKDQKSETCGPYSILKISRALLIDSDYGLTEDSLAQLCGTTISKDEKELSDRFRGKNEDDLDPADREMFYPLEMKVSDREEELGTSAVGVYKTAERVFGDNFDVLPFYAEIGDETNFSAERFKRLGQILWENIQDADLNVILNLQVNLLCSNSGMKSPVDIFSFLSTDRCGQLDEWSVGHFVILAGMIRKIQGDREEIYYILQENYKKRGMSGYLVQPSENLRSALIRNDGKQGGMIAIVPKAKGDITRNLTETLSSGVWDNGTPFSE